MNNMQYVVKDDMRYAMHVAVELCEQGDFDSVTDAFRWLMQERDDSEPWSGKQASEAIAKLRQTVRDAFSKTHISMLEEGNAIMRAIDEVEAAEQGSGTCELDYDRHCSNCGVCVHESAVLIRKELDGGLWTVVSKPASFCPNCGARIRKAVE